MNKAFKTICFPFRRKCINSNIRRQLYNVNDMKEEFDTVSLRKIVSFLRQSGLSKLL